MQIKVVTPLPTRSDPDSALLHPPYSAFVRELYNNKDNLRALMKPRYEEHEDMKAKKAMKKAKKAMKKAKKAMKEMKAVRAMKAKKAMKKAKRQ